MIDLDQSLMTLYQQGLSLNDIQKKVGLSTTTIRRRLQYLGVDLRPRGGPRHTNILLQDLIKNTPEAQKIIYDDNLSLHTRAKKLGVGPNTLINFLKGE